MTSKFWAHPADGCGPALSHRIHIGDSWFQNKNKNEIASLKYTWFELLTDNIWVLTQFTNTLKIELLNFHLHFRGVSNST
jgi:hypothetical protein